MSQRQMEVLAEIECGSDTQGVADALGLTYWGAHRHIKNLRHKLGAKTLADLPDRARELGVAVPRCEE